jgi:hypothetical protein
MSTHEETQTAPRADEWLRPHKEQGEALHELGRAVRRLADLGMSRGSILAWAKAALPKGQK